MSINVLGLTTGKEYAFVLGVEGKDSISGKIMCIMDVRFTGIGFQNYWAQILKESDKIEGITYAFSVIKGSKQWAYVGKTVRTFKDRYSSGPAGGLEELCKFYDPKDSMLDCALYNVSNPALAEGWCYQKVTADKRNFTNVHDPS